MMNKEEIREKLLNTKSLLDRISEDYYAHLYS